MNRAQEKSSPASFWSRDLKEGHKSDRDPELMSLDSRGSKLDLTMISSAASN